MFRICIIDLDDNDGIHVNLIVTRQEAQVILRAVSDQLGPAEAPKRVRPRFEWRIDD